ncbi:retrovirus-related pol polyprotein from transposon TNT 1-94 [Tanacetum coccineum]
MASSATATPAILVFSGTHYHIWAVKMKTYLKSQGLWKVVETDESIPALGENPTVAQLGDTKGDINLETFEGTDRVKAVRLLTLKREFELLRMKDDELVKDYSARMMDVVNQMRLYGEVVTDQKVVEKMMISVPPKFEAKISAIERVLIKKARNKHQGVQQANVSEEDQSRHQRQPKSEAVKHGRYTECTKGKSTFDMEQMISFFLKLDVADASAFSVTEDDSMKWHKRFGHFNYRTLQHIYSTKLVRDMPPISEVDSKCEGCELGKSRRSYTSWSCKASVFSIFKSFKKLVEVQSGSTLRILRTDNGGEYTSNEFEYFLRQQGVIHQVTVPYSPQQNGVSERKNRTVMEMARSMLYEKKLPKTFWAVGGATICIFAKTELATIAVQWFIKSPID